MVARPGKVDLVAGLLWRGGRLELVLTFARRFQLALPLIGLFELVLLLVAILELSLPSTR